MLLKKVGVLAFCVMLSGCLGSSSRPRMIRMDMNPVSPANLNERLQQFKLTTRTTCPENQNCASVGYTTDLAQETITPEILGAIPGVELNTLSSAPQITLSRNLIIEAPFIDLGSESVIDTRGFDLKMSARSVSLGQIKTQSPLDKDPGSVVIVSENISIQAIDTHAPEQHCATHSQPFTAPIKLDEDNRLIIEDYRSGLPYQWIVFQGECTQETRFKYRLTQAGDTLLAILEEPLETCPITLEVDWISYEKLRPAYDGSVNVSAHTGGSIHLFSKADAGEPSMKLNAQGTSAAGECPARSIFGDTFFGDTLPDQPPQLYALVHIPKRIALHPPQGSWADTGQSLGETENIRLSLSEIRGYSEDSVIREEEDPVDIYVPLHIENLSGVLPHLSGLSHHFNTSGESGVISAQSITEDQWEFELPKFLKSHGLVYP